MRDTQVQATTYDGNPQNVNSGLIKHTHTNMKTVITLSAFLLGGALSAQAATLLSADFTSHGGTTASLPTTGNITAGAGVSSLGSSILPFADGVADTFEVELDSANYAVVDERPDAVTTNAYFSFDFTTNSALSITSATANVNRMRATGEIHLEDTMGTGSLDIYNGTDLIGSLTTTYGLLGGGADKTVNYSGTAIDLEANTTYSARFVSDAGGAPGTIGFQSFEVVAAAVPEPSSSALLAIGSVSLILGRKRPQSHK